MASSHLATPVGRKISLDMVLLCTLRHTPPGFSNMPTFLLCYFTTAALKGTEVTTYTKGNTCFTAEVHCMCSNTLNIQFKGEVNFIENNNSALHLFSSILLVDANSKIPFKKNTGYQGGAIHMEGFASIYLNDNTSIVFDSNLALNKGGAIYHVTPVDHSHYSVRNCFVNYIGECETVNDRKINVDFINNTIKNDKKESIATYSHKRPSVASYPPSCMQVRFC